MENDIFTSSLLPVFPHDRGIVAVKGEGSWLFTKDGQKYLDFTMGVASNSLGHCHPALVESLTLQANTLWHVSNHYQTHQQSDFADNIIADSFADFVFFCNSGAEGIEGAIKIARSYDKNRFRVITFTGSFHGRTFGALAATGKKDMSSLFEPMIEGFDKVPFGSYEEVEKAIKPDTAAILVEPILGEGGIVPPPNGWLKFLRESCDKNGLALIFDEIQSGIGRTGKMFAHEWDGVYPDIMPLAKGIGSGFPLGAILSTKKISKNMGIGAHGSTFGGNPLAMAVGHKIWSIISSKDFLNHVEKMGNILQDILHDLAKKYPTVIKNVRGKGLFIGIECACSNKTFIIEAQNERLLIIGSAENTVRFLPALNVNEAELELASQSLKKVCSKIASEL